MTALGVFVTGLLALASDQQGTRFAAADLALYVYAGALYLAYVGRTHVNTRPEFEVLTLYAGPHRVHDRDGAQLRLRSADLRHLGHLRGHPADHRRSRTQQAARSVVAADFAASVLKILLLDLTGSPSIVRVATLVVAGATLYAGGWLYQRVGRE